MAFGTTPLSTTSLGANEFPATAVYVEGTAGGNFTAMQGGPASSADGNGNISAPVATYVPDGNDVALGTSTDAAGHASVIGQLKQIEGNTASVVVGTLPTLPAGANTIGAVTQAGGPWAVQPQAGTTGGTTPYHDVVSSGTNGTNVKNAAGQVYDGVISNTSASAVYFRLYDIASSPTVGTTTVKRTIQVPGNGTVIFSWPNGLKFTAGISWGITAAIADADTTAISAAVSIDFGYA